MQPVYYNNRPINNDPLIHPGGESNSVFPSQRTGEESSLRSLDERNECSDECGYFWEVVTFPLVFIFQLITYPFYLLLGWILDWEMPMPPPPYGLRYPTDDELSEDVVALAAPYKICEEQLSKRPDKINFSELATKVDGVDLAELMSLFDATFAHIDDMSPEEVQTLRNNMDTYYRFVKDRILYSSTSQAYTDEYFNNLELIVKNLIVLLRQDETELPRDSKERVFKELASLANYCEAQKYEEALRQYKRLTKGLSLDQEFLTWLQGLKEELIFPFLEIHTLNSLRRLPAGEEWGLDVDNDNTQDPYAQDAYVDQYYYGRILKGGYTPARMISAIYEKQKVEGSGTLVAECFQKLYTDGDISDEIAGDDLTFSSLYEGDGRTLSHFGVATLLEIFGHIKK